MGWRSKRQKKCKRDREAKQQSSHSRNRAEVATKKRATRNSAMFGTLSPPCGLGASVRNRGDVFRQNSPPGRGFPRIRRINTEQLNQKESHRRDAENAEVPSLGAHSSSVPRVSNTLHAGCVRSQEHAEENPWQPAKDFRLSSTE